MFSIIIPTYNRASLLLETIHSALSQGFERNDFEVIVVDDGSTDNTKELIGAIHDDRLKYIWKENGERGAARNFGATHAKGQYLYFLDSDDILYSNHLAVAKEFIVAQNSPLWFFQFYEIKDVGRTKQIQVNQTNPEKQLVMQGNFLSCHGVFLEANFFMKFQFDEDRDLSGSEDYELWLRIISQSKLQVNPQVTSCLVLHEARSVFNFSPETMIKRKELFLQKITSNNLIVSKYSNWFPALKSNTYSYLALHLVLAGARNKAFKYITLSIKHYPKSVFSNRFLAILKHLLIK